MRNVRSCSQSIDPLSYRYYDKDRIVLGKSMKEWIRPSVTFWHTMNNDGSDPFGSPTKHWPWLNSSATDMEKAKAAMHALFELLSKLDVDLWAFHDRDIAPEVKDACLINSNLRLKFVSVDPNLR